MKKIRFSRILSALMMGVMFTGAFAGTPASGKNENVFSDSGKFAQWEVVGPTGGDVRVVTIDPRDKDRLYISTMDGQIHTSADGGKSWKLLVNLNRPQLVLDQLFVDSRDSKIIYTSGNRGKGAGGFFKTTDSGATWKESKDLRNEAVHAMVQSVVDPDVLFVGTTDGVWTSTNSGDDWKKIESPTMPVNLDSLAVDPKNPATLYAGTTWRPYKSTDGGKNWALIKEGMIDDSDVFAINVDSRNAEHIIASACSGIYESFNGGGRWAKIQGIPSQSRRTRDIVQNPGLPGAVYAGTTEGFWMTANGGKSWALTTPRNIEINSIAVHADEPNRIFIGTNNYGVMVSNDGGKNFVPTNINFTSRFTYSVTPDVSQPNRLYATTQNTSSSGGFVFTSNDAGQSWTQAKSLDVNRVSPFAVLQDRVDPNQMYLGTNIGIYQSSDRGNTWKLVEAPPPVKKPASRRRSSAAARKGTTKKTTAAAKTSATPAKAAVANKDEAPVDPNFVPYLTEKVKVLTFTEDDKHGIFAGTDSGLYRSYDIAKGWEKIPLGDGLDNNIFVVYSTPLVPGTIWVGTASSGVLMSNDDGKTWAKTAGIPEKIPVSSIVSDPKRPNYIYVGTSQAFYLSRDGGRTWTRRGGNLPVGNYTSILIDPNNSDELFVSSALESDGGVYYSENAGMKWKRLDAKDMKIPSRRVWAMAFDPQDSNRIFAGSHSSGVYVIERKREAAVVDKDAKPAAVPGN